MKKQYSFIHRVEEAASSENLRWEKPVSFTSLNAVRHELPDNLYSFAAYSHYILLRFFRLGIYFHARVHSSVTMFGCAPHKWKYFREFPFFFVSLSFHSSSSSQHNALFSTKLRWAGLIYGKRANERMKVCETRDCTRNWDGNVPAKSKLLRLLFSSIYSDFTFYVFSFRSFFGGGSRRYCRLLAPSVYPEAKASATSRGARGKNPQKE